MTISRASQQEIHEYNRCMPHFSNEHSLIEKLEHLVTPIPSNPNLVELRGDYFYTQSTGTPTRVYESPVFDRIDVDSIIRKLSALLKMNIHCCSESPRIDPLNNLLYLDVKGMVAALIFMVQMEAELGSASGIVRFLIHEDYSILEEDLPIQSLTLSLLFLHLIATGFKSAFMDYWISAPFHKICEQYGKYGLAKEIMIELYGVQIEFCKAF
jgi:hypothetical protein